MSTIRTRTHASAWPALIRITAGVAIAGVCLAYPAVLIVGVFGLLAIAGLAADGLDEANGEHRQP